MTIARSTDPLSSKIARVSETIKDEVLHAITVHGPVTCHEILKVINDARKANGGHRRQIDISCISSVPSQLIRDGKIHVDGWKANPATGNKCELYLLGARPGEGTPMPALSTGPRRKKAYQFTNDEIHNLIVDSANDDGSRLSLKKFTANINAQLRKKAS